MPGLAEQVVSDVVQLMEPSQWTLTSRPAYRHGLWSALLQDPNANGRRIRRSESGFMLEISALDVSERVVAFSIQGAGVPNPEEEIPRLSAGEPFGNDPELIGNDPELNVAKTFKRLSSGADFGRDERLLVEVLEPRSSVTALLYEPFTDEAIDLFVQLVAESQYPGVLAAGMIDAMRGMHLPPDDLPPDRVLSAIDTWRRVTVPIFGAAEVEVEVVEEGEELLGIVGCPAWHINVKLLPAVGEEPFLIGDGLGVWLREFVPVGLQKGTVDFDFESLPAEPHVVVRRAEPLRTMLRV